MNNEIKEYDYINSINEPKKLVIYPLKDRVYPFILWSRRTGDFCGHGHLTPDELHNWLVHYGLGEK
jgi:hypothetical protein